MLPDPLHPAVVHFPIVLALLAPLVAAGLVWAVRSGRAPARAFAALAVLQVAIVGAGWLAMETGEHEEERVERVVRESLIEAHEEAAERFLWLAALLIPLAAAGVMSGPRGELVRGVTLVATLGVAWAVMDVGHKGGELVYKHGAAAAYTDAGSGANTPVAARSHHDHDDD